MSNESHNSNRGAWYQGKDKSVVIKSAPMPKPKQDEVVIEAQAWAINPIDYKLQTDLSGLVQQVPNINGVDLAGIVTSVGDGVSLFNVGDRVLAVLIRHAAFLHYFKPEYGAFQNYVLVPAACVVRFPSSMSFTDAAVVPLGLSTAATCLYSSAHCHLTPPGHDTTKTKQVVLVTGGASSVGASAIQLAKASGYSVVTTASEKNYATLKQKLRADAVVDYNKANMVDLVAEEAAKLGSLVGVVESISLQDTQTQVRDICEKLKVEVPVALTLPSQFPDNKNFIPAFATQLFFDNDKDHLGYLPEIKDGGQIGQVIFSWVQGALERGEYIPYPPAKIVGTLDDAQAAINLQKNGVSAEKIVLSLSK